MDAIELSDIVIFLLIIFYGYYSYRGVIKRRAKKEQLAPRQEVGKIVPNFEQVTPQYVEPQKPATRHYTIPKPVLDSEAEGVRAIVTKEIVEEIPKPDKNTKRDNLRRAIIMGEILKPKFDNCEI